MGKFYTSIPVSHMPWIEKQQMFWVASAPLRGDGHVNLSPKATPNCFHIVNEHQVWYEDLTGSGIETISHLREPGNGRVTLLFHSFEGAPRILRIWGTGLVHEFGTPQYDAFIPVDQRKPGSRAVIVINVRQVGTSCGFGVPLYTFKSHRTQLLRWCDTLEQFDRTADADNAAQLSKGMKAWWTKENTSSLDGLPGLQVAHETQVPLINQFDRNARPAVADFNIGYEGGAKGTVRVRNLLESAIMEWLDVRVVLAFVLGMVVTKGYGMFIRQVEALRL